MRISYSGLEKNPFATDSAGDPYFWHSNALRQRSSLVSAIKDQHRLMVLTGERGVGKTSFLRRIKRETAPDIDFHFIDDTHSSLEKLTESLCSHYLIGQTRGDSIRKPDLLAKFLKTPDIHASQHYVVVINNAGHIELDVLKELILLGNFDRERALQFILVGSDEMLPTLRTWSGKCLGNCIKFWGKLTCLSRKDTRRLIEKHLETAKFQGKSPFATNTIHHIYEYSRGNPKIIKTICGLALLNARLENLTRVSPEIVDEVAKTCLIAHQPETGHPAVKPVNNLLKRQPDSETVPAADPVRTASREQYKKLGIPEPAQLTDSAGVSRLPSPDLNYRNWKKLFKRG